MVSRLSAIPESTAPRLEPTIAILTELSNRLPPVAEPGDRVASSGSIMIPVLAVW